MWKPSCKSIAERDALTEHSIHLKKLRKIKSRVDNRPPKELRHVHMNAKKELNSLKTQAEIQYQNQVLLQKLRKIEEIGGKAQEEHRIKGNYFSKIRLDELERIGGENQKILNRIQSAKSYYPVEKHKSDFMTSQYLKLQLSENAGRIPKNTSYNVMEFLEHGDTNRSGKTTRPNTAANPVRAVFGAGRPISAKQVNFNL